MLYFSIDYEFSGDGSGNFSNDLIHKTSILLDALKKNTIQANFFIEVEEIISLKSNGLYGLYKQVCNQIREINQCHSLSLHSHPQFKDALFFNGLWQVDLSKTSLDQELLSTANNQCYIESLIDKWNEIMFDSKLNDLKPRAFRAGGYNINNIESLAIKLAAQNINIESSVLPGVEMKNAYTSIDHSMFSKFPFLISNQVKEFPVSTSKQRHISKIYDFNYIFDKVINKNISYSNKVNFKKNNRSMFYKFIKSEIKPIDFILSSRHDLLQARKMLYNDGYLHMIGHNKSIYSKNALLKNLDIFSKLRTEVF